MNLQDLAQILKLQGEILRASRADASDVEDVLALAAFLKKFGPMSVEDFCSGYGAVPGKTKATKVKKAEHSTSDNLQAAAYVSRLKADPLGFEATIASIENDSSLSLPALKAIVIELVGTASGIGSKKKAIAALLKWQDDNKAREHRGANVAGGF